MTTEETGVDSRTVGEALDAIEDGADALSVPGDRGDRGRRLPPAPGTARDTPLLSRDDGGRVPLRGLQGRTGAADRRRGGGRDGADRTHLLRRAKEVTSELDIDLSGFADATRYVERYVGELELPGDVAARASDIVDACEDAGIAGGKSPSGWAAAAVYNACVEADMKVRQDTLTELADVTHVTIRNRYQEQRELLYEQNPPPRRRTRR